MHQRIDPAPLGERWNVCPQCGDNFHQKRSWQRFCKSACRRAFHKGAGGGDINRRMAELERRVAELERLALPVR